MKNTILHSSPFSGSEKVNLFAKTIFGYLTIGNHRKADKDFPGAFGFYHWVLSPLATNSISLSSDELTLTVVIDAALLAHRQPEKMVFFNHKNSVVFSEAWEASADINEGLNATRPIIIYPGKYKLEHMDRVFVLSIRLRLAGTTFTNLLHAEKPNPVSQFFSGCYHFLFPGHGHGHGANLHGFQS